MLLAAAVALSFYGLLHYWLGRRLIGPIRTSSRPQKIAWGVVLLFAVFGILSVTYGRSTPRTALVAGVQWTGMIALGMMTVTVGLVVLRDVLWAGYLLLQRYLTAQAPVDDPVLRQQLEARRTFLKNASSLAVVGAAATLSARGVKSAREIAAIKDVDIPIDGLDPALDGFRILQLSDIHVGDTIRRDHFQRIVSRAMSVPADLLVITGDLVDGTVDELRDDVAPITQLTSPHGVYFITGNHEYYSGPLAWVDHLRSLGIHVLLDEHVELDHAGAPIVLAGITDEKAYRSVPTHTADPVKAFEGAREDALRILLAHQPASYPKAKGLGVHLQLSGHTHGGQIWPFGYLVPLQQHFIAGLHRVFGSTWLYISRGTGYWGPPMRVGSPSEITVLTLRRR